MTKTNRSHFFPEKFEFYKTLTFDSQFQTQVMDFKAMSTTTASATASINTPDTDTELIPTSDPKSGPFRSFSFNTGTLLKPHHHPFHLPPPQTTPVGYRECLKNHAASLGGHALDGCGEFYPSPISNPADPTSLKCAACGCHRNFHRRDWPDEPRAFTPPKAFLVSSTHHHHHHRVLPPPPARHSMSPSPSRSTSPGPSTTLSPHSPPPVSHVPPSFFGTPTQMLLALSSAAYTGPPPDEKLSNNPTGGKSTTGRKRSRTKFSQEQKDKMFSFAEKLGWRMQRSEDKFVEDFCDEIGIGRNVFKIWMHNNKHQRRQRLLSSAGLINDCDRNYGGDAVGGNSFDSNAEEDNNNNNNVNAITNSPNESSRDDHHHQRFYLSNNGSSSSS